MKKDFLLSSMTAYGQSARGEIAVEMQSLNRRYLDIQLTLPPGCSSFEMEIRSLIGRGIQRGLLTLTISLRGERGNRLVPNLPLARALHAGWKEISQEVGGEFSLSLLAQERALFLPSDERVERAPLFAVVEEALDRLIEMRRQEGARLGNDLQQRLERVEHLLDALEEGTTRAPSRYRERLKQRIAEVLEGADALDQRLLYEVALFAERCDVSEEIVRFRSHLVAFRAALFEEEGCGKKLDFLLQEMVRESHTIASKGQETARVIEIKCELEKMKEQVQNIE